MTASRAALMTMALVLCTCLKEHPTQAKNRIKVKALRGTHMAPMPNIKPVVAETTRKPLAQHVGPIPRYRPLSAEPLGQLPKAKRRALSSTARRQSAQFQRMYQGQHARKALIETDKPLYLPGEELWVRAVEMSIANNALPNVEQRAYFRLLDARRRIVQTKLVKVQRGHSHTTFRLSHGISGGTYQLQYVNVMNHVAAQHTLRVQRYSTQRIRKVLRFLRRGLGPGDRALATFKLLQTPGKQSSPRAFEVLLRIDGKIVKRWQQTTNAKGRALLAFRLPSTLKGTDGQLIIKLRRAGTTETLVRTIPIARKQIDVGLFPEGGQSVVGLPSRIYFAAKDARTRTPVDVRGVIKNKQGNIVARVRSFHRGMGRFRYTPKRGQRYTLHITTPGGIAKTWTLPTPRTKGIAIQLFDDFRSQRNALHLRIHSSTAQPVFALLTQRRQIVGRASWQLKQGAQRVQIKHNRKRRGIVRITLFHASTGQPLAERLTFSQRKQHLKLTITTQRQHFQPRDKVTLTIKASGPNGKPVPNAHLGISVVDDGILRQADAHEPSWLAQRYLTTTALTGRLFRPNFYFSAHPKAPRSLDLVMGTHGWRRFRWTSLRKPPKPQVLLDAKQLQREWKKQFKRTKVPPRPRVPKPTSNDWKRWFPAPLLLHKPKSRSKPQPTSTQKLPKPPNDMDKDGIPDISDKCPRTPGPRSNRGCPTSNRKIVVFRSQIRIRTNIYFRSNAVRIYKRSYPVLNQVAAILKRYPKLLIRIEGHTDQRGNVLYNQRLSLQRAKRIRNYLIKKGIHPTRLIPIGYGKSRPLVPGNTRRAHDINNRVSFYIINRRWSKPTGPWWLYTASARVFPTRFYSGTNANKGPYDKRSTVLWLPHVKTDASGKASISFGLSDRQTTYRIRLAGVGKGHLGTATSYISASNPIQLAIKWPNTVSAGDAIALPVTAHNHSKQTLAMRITLKELPLGRRHFRWSWKQQPTLAVKPGQSATWFVPIRVASWRGLSRLYVALKAGRYTRGQRQWIRVNTQNFPHEHNDSGALVPGKPKRIVIVIPKGKRGTAPTGYLHLYPGLMSRLRKSASGMLREPHGCFEQTSSSNFPNTMLLQLLKTFPQAAKDTALFERANALLLRGAARLKRFRNKSGGYGLYIGRPGSVWLTAYGIFQFSEMKRVIPFPTSAIKNAVRWLRRQRTPNGAYQPRSYWRRVSSPVIMTAYVAFALAEAGFKGLDKELNYLTKSAYPTRDAYTKALILNAMLRAWGKDNKRTKRWAASLLQMQQKNGSFRGLSSVVGSYGRDLKIQATALAILGLSRAGTSWSRLMKAVYWLQRQARKGTFGSTQATVMALKALIAYQRQHATPTAIPAKLVVRINGTALPPLTCQHGNPRIAALHRISPWLTKLKPGRNELTMQLYSAKPMPYEFQLAYTSPQPAPQADAPLHMKLAFDKTRAKLGDVIRLSIQLTNRSRREQWFPLLRVHAPAGLRLPTKPLETMQKRRIIDLFETKGRKLYLYLRHLKPGETKRISVDYVADVTGYFIGNASQVAPYYMPTKASWTAPLHIAIDK